MNLAINFEYALYYEFCLKKFNEIFPLLSTISSSESLVIEGKGDFKIILEIGSNVYKKERNLNQACESLRNSC